MLPLPRALAANLEARGLHYGWLVIVVAFLSTGLAIGSSQYAFGIFVEPLEKDFRWTRTQINAALSFGAVSGAIAPLVGRLMDRVGAGPVMVVSMALIALSYLLRPYMTELWHWYGLSILLYVGYPGATILPAGRLVGIWFPRTRGRMMGFTTMGNNFGGLTLTPLAGAITTAASWQWAFRAFGFAGALVAMATLLAVREHPRVTSRARGQGQEGAGGSRASPPPAQTALTGTSVREALRGRLFYLLTLGIVIASFTYPAVLTQVIPHLQKEGASVGRASLMLSLMAAFGMVGKLLFGYLAERITARRALMLSLVIQILGLLILTTQVHSALFWLFPPVFGIPFGGVGALIVLVVQEAFGLRYYGSIAGLVNLASTIPTLVGPLMVGAIVDSTNSYKPAFLVVIGLFVVGFLVLSMARPPAARGKAQSPATH